MVRSKRGLSALLGACAAAALLVGAARAGTDEDRFARVYGGDIRRVLATKDVADDVQLARALLIAARRAQGRPGLCALLCENAHRLGLRGPDGYATAIEAMSLLAERFPDRKDEAAEKTITAREMQFRGAEGQRREDLREELVRAMLSLARSRAGAGDRPGAARMAERAAAFALGPWRQQILQRAREYAAQEDLADPKAAAEFLAAYGQRIQEVLATRTTRDEAELATMFSIAAQDSCVGTPRMILLCEHAYRLGKRSPAGYRAAITAMELLAGRVPSKRAEAWEKLVALYQLQGRSARGARRREAYENMIRLLLGLADVRAAAGRLAEAMDLVRRARSAAAEIDPGDRPEIEAKLSDLAARGEVIEEIGRLKACLRARPGDAAARRRLILLCVAELDDPLEARGWLTPQTDPALRRLVQLACKSPGEPTGPESLELADWYKSLAQDSTLARARMLEHALGAYQRYLAGSAAGTPERPKAVLAVACIEQMLAKLAAPGAGPAGHPPEAEWIDLLKLAHPAEHALRGRWSRLPGGLHVAPGPGAGLVLPVQPDGSYELELQVRPEAGNGKGVVAVALPVGRTAVEVILGPEGGLGSGLQMIRRLGYRNNPTRTKGGLTPRSVNTVLIRVTRSPRQADIGVVVDGRRLIRWRGPLSQLSPGAFRMPDVRAVGLAAYLREVLFQAVRLRMIDGEAKRLTRGRARTKPSRR